MLYKYLRALLSYSKIYVFVIKLLTGNYIPYLPYVVEKFFKS